MILCTVTGEDYTSTRGTISGGHVPNCLHYLFFLPVHPRIVSALEKLLKQQDKYIHVNAYIILMLILS